MSRQDITGDEASGDHKKKGEDNYITSMNLKFILSTPGMTIAPQKHCFVDPFRTLIAMHEDTAAEPGRDAQTAQTEPLMMKTTELGGYLHFLQVAADLM